MSKVVGCTGKTVVRRMRDLHMDGYGFKTAANAARALFPVNFQNHTRRRAHGWMRTVSLAKSMTSWLWAAQAAVNERCNNTKLSAPHAAVLAIEHAARALVNAAVQAGAPLLAIVRVGDEDDLVGLRRTHQTVSSRMCVPQQSKVIVESSAGAVPGDQTRRWRRTCSGTIR